MSYLNLEQCKEIPIEDLYFAVIFSQPSNSEIKEKLNSQNLTEKEIKELNGMENLTKSLVKDYKDAVLPEKIANSLTDSFCLSFVRATVIFLMKYDKECINLFKNEKLDLKKYIIEDLQPLINYYTKDQFRFIQIEDGSVVINVNSSKPFDDYVNAYFAKINI